MQDDSLIIEFHATATSDGLPDDYRLACDLAWAGSNDDAKRIYCRLLAETASPTLQALVYNDLAALAGSAAAFLAALQRDG